MANDKKLAKHEDSESAQAHTETARTQITSLSTSFDVPLPGRTVVYGPRKDNGNRK